MTLSRSYSREAASMLTEHGANICCHIFKWLRKAQIFSFRKLKEYSCVGAITIFSSSVGSVCGKPDLESCLSQLRSQTQYCTDHKIAALQTICSIELLQLILGPRADAWVTSLFSASPYTSFEGSREEYAILSYSFVTKVSESATSNLKTDKRWRRKLNRKEREYLSTGERGDIEGSR